MIRTARQAKNSIPVRELHRLLAAGQTGFLLDVRTPGEFDSVHLPGAKCIPLGELDAATLSRWRGPESVPVYVLCQAGGRAARAIEKLENGGMTGCILVEGGTQAWIDAGLPVERGSLQVLPLMRQVQIAVGLVSAAGAALALLVNPLFALIPLITGCGLLFAGVTGVCGLALVLAKMPWNRSGASDSCCLSRTKE